MSYDIRLNCELDNAHGFGGGTYVVGGTNEPWLNITYNYSEHFHRVLGERGIRSIYGLSARESVTPLSVAILAIEGQTDPDYWASTAGNARNALIGVLGIALMAISEGKGDAIWSGD